MHRPRRLAHQRLVDLLLTLITVVSLVIVPTSQGFLTHRLEFDLAAGDFLVYLTGIALVASIAVLATLQLATRLHPWVVPGLVGLSLLSLVESQFLGHAYAPLAGTMVKAENVLGTPIGNSVVWLTAAVVVALGHRRISQHVVEICLGLTALQIGYLLLTLWSAGGAAAGQSLRRADGHAHSLSSERNVLLFILDATQSDVFNELLANGEIEREAFAGFTYFRNAVSGYPMTQASIPNALSGRFYRNEEPFRDYATRLASSDGYVGNLGRAAGYDVEVYTTPRVLPGNDDVRAYRGYDPRGEMTRVVEFSLFRQLPRVLKGWLYRGGRWRLSSAAGLSEDLGLIDNLRFHAGLDQLRPNAKRPQLKVFHLKGSHAPHQHDERMHAASLSDTRENYARVVTGVGTLMATLLARLEDIGVYDQSCIVFLGDHGYGYRVALPRGDERLFHDAKPLRFHSKGLPLLMVKPFDAREPLQINDAPVELADLPATLASILGKHIDGTRRSVFDVAPDAQRDRRHYDLADLAWDIETDRLAPMREWRIFGHAWLADSWSSTGRNLGDAGELLENFRRIQPGAKHLGPPALESTREVPRAQLTNNHDLRLRFPNGDVEQGEFISVTFPVERLAPESPHRLALTINDAYRSVNPGRLRERIYLNDALVDEYDIGGADDRAERTVTVHLPKGAERADIRFEVTVTAAEDGGWGNVGHRIRRVAVMREAPSL